MQLGGPVLFSYDQRRTTPKHAGKSEAAVWCRLLLEGSLLSIIEDRGN
jgi:hypothetical protein